jgi:hypothetical protein
VFNQTTEGERRRVRFSRGSCPHRNNKANSAHKVRRQLAKARRRSRPKKTFPEFLSDLFAKMENLEDQNSDVWRSLVGRKATNNTLPP